MKIKRDLGIITVKCECGREIVFRLKRGNGFEVLSEKTEIEQQKTEIEQQKTEKEPKIKIKFPWSYD